MKMPFKRSQGSITVETAMVTVMIMVPMAYALVGGPGNVLEPERVPISTSYSEPTDPSQPMPGLLQVLDDRQHDFSAELNQP